jgi:hypothetical protein
MIENNLPNGYGYICLLGFIVEPSDRNWCVMSSSIEGCHKMIVCPEYLFVETFIDGGDSFIFTLTHTNVFGELDYARIQEIWESYERVEVE